MQEFAGTTANQTASEEYLPRQSGDVAWRESRGEMGSGAPGVQVAQLPPLNKPISPVSQPIK